MTTIVNRNAAATLYRLLCAAVSAAILLFLSACADSGGANHADSPPYELQSHYKGELRRLAGRVRYYARLLGDAGAYRMEITLTEAGETVQTLEYAYREDFDPRSFRYGVVAADADGDGTDDLLLDMGIRGQSLSFACFLYDEQTSRYAAVPGFEELGLPIFISGEGAILTSWEGGEDGVIIYGASKYHIEDGALILTASLGKTAAITGDGQETWVYTEKRLANGVMYVAFDRAPLDSVNLEDWVGCGLFWEWEGDAPECYSTGPVSFEKAIPVTPPEIQDVRDSGCVSANGRQRNYYARVSGNAAGGYAAEILIIDAEIENEVQTVRCEYPTSYNPEPARRVMLQEDATGDGSQDLLIVLDPNDAPSYACFAYDAVTDRYVYTPGYEEIISPVVIDGQGVVLSRWESGAMYGADRYEFTGTEWIRAARLAVNPTDDAIYFDGSAYPPSFTEERESAKTGVTAGEIDHGYWFWNRHVFRDF